jgi:hypothetical protein
VTSPHAPASLQALLGAIPEGITKAQLDELGRTWYREYILDPFADGQYRAAVPCHDAKIAYFFENKYDHAFWGSERKDWGQKKEFPCPVRIARIPWVVPVIQGKVPGVSCYRVVEHASQCRPKPEQRLYVCREHRYVVWLRKRTDDAFSLESAYQTTWRSIDERYTYRQSKIWPRI